MASSLLIRIRSSCSIQIFRGLLQCFVAFGVHLRRLSARLLCQLTCYGRCLRLAALRACRLLVASVDPFWALLFYFVSNSIMGFLLLRILEPRRGTPPPLRDLDLFFTSVSATTLSSMSTVEMEALLRGQLAVVAILMLAGCEVFTSTLHLHLILKVKLLREAAGGGDALTLSATGTHTGINKDGGYEIELRQMTASPDIEAAHDEPVVDGTNSDWELRYKSISLLGIVVLWYNVVLVLLGSAAIFLYFSGGPREILRKKGLHVLDFSVFLSVSSFTNCGFVPTNENMLPFRKNSCLLLLNIPLILAGNTLFPVCLRLVVWVLRRRVFSERAKLFDYLLSHSNGRQLGFHHLVSKSRCLHLLLTAVSFLGVQIILLCCMEWNSDAMGDDMSAYEKAVAVLFQSVNSRHAGESVFDLSKLSSAILVLYVVMMYLPAYTTFSPVGDEVSIPAARRNGRRNTSPKLLPKSLILSQLSYIAIFTILVCITERRKLAEDPLNFNVLSIVVEVVSAHGNVGFSTGYSCGRRLKPDGGCKDEWYGFVGWWSNSGKLILITVMFFGRLKKFNERGGRAWKLT